ncbi:carbamoyl-phosphate synthase large subunit [Natranaerovirga pectinivora]|uniref:Carbamoyl-phosphate synthase large subunit n=1 Tax=Natranaerovirga pectinivora TaxID=682400 RepID=A0A4R3MJX2_9FIRM|nr:ATP-grasp domain-containing protein [Natranaerovirga pectinivora]TCT14034.1 carbamoyl-phosphate synthase large subunit [Natranaerovirga pectinivora]
MNILLTAIGKRVQLIKYFKEKFNIIGVDASNQTPGSHFTNKFYTAPPCTHKQYINVLLEICLKEKINILIPLLESEFFLLDMNREKFQEIGTFIMLSDIDVLTICNDKWATYKFFKENSINTPISHIKIIDEKLEFPLIIKPRQGMGSKQVFKVKDKEELEFYIKRIEKPLIQEFVQGVEYTIDCFCDEEGCPIAIIPRERIEIRAGEVSKSKTIKSWDIIDAAVNVCRKLKAIGPITIQCIKMHTGEIKFIEINSRLGGGVPLAFQAGVNYGELMMQLAMKEKIYPMIGEFKEITMLRYDEAVFYESCNI